MFSSNWPETAAEMWLTLESCYCLPEGLSFSMAKSASTVHAQYKRQLLYTTIQTLYMYEHILKRARQD